MTIPFYNVCFTGTKKCGKILAPELYKKARLEEKPYRPKALGLTSVENS
jgi:hypothetical protein